MVTTELSELRAELWRTRDDLQRIKSRAPSADFQRSTPLSKQRPPEGASFGGLASSPRLSSPMDMEWNGGRGRGDIGGMSHPATSRSGSDREASDAPLFRDLDLEKEAFKEWTDEAASIAIKLIEEVKLLRWERDAWREREAHHTRERTVLQSRADNLEKKVMECEVENRRLNEEIVRLKEAERDQASAADRYKAELRAAHQKAGTLRAQVAAVEGKVAAVVAGETEGRGAIGAISSALKDDLKRERDATDALQRQLDAARAAAAKHARERHAWQESRGRLDQLRVAWGKQLKKVAKKMNALSRQNAALQKQVKQYAQKAKGSESAAAANAANAAAAEMGRKLRAELRQLTEQGHHPPLPPPMAGVQETGAGG
ncbi:unnamed protein product, partial [Discosporangium mesarthrocarpum]